MRTLAFLFALSCTLPLAGQTVSKVAFTESKSAVRAFSAYGKTTISVVRAQLDIRRSDGKIKRSNLVVIYDPESGHFLWRNTLAHHSGFGTGDYICWTGWARALLYARKSLRPRAPRARRQP